MVLTDAHKLVRLVVPAHIVDGSCVVVKRKHTIAVRRIPDLDLEARVREVCMPEEHSPRTLLSAPPVATNFPDGDKASAYTAPSWPTSEATFSPDFLKNVHTSVSM